MPCSTISYQTNSICTNCNCKTCSPCGDEVPGDPSSYVTSVSADECLLVECDDQASESLASADAVQADVAESAAASSDYPRQPHLVVVVVRYPEGLLVMAEAGWEVADC